MKKLLLVAAVVMVCVTAYAGKNKHLASKKAEKKDVAADVVKQLGQTEVCNAMAAIGVKTIYDLPGGAKVSVEEKTVKSDGAEYVFKAIKYSDGRYAARVITKNGAACPRVDEFLLILNGKIPNTGLAGGWFPKRDQGTSFEFGYGKLGANPSVKVVATLADGRVVKQVTQDGIVPYFAVEKTRKVKQTLSPVAITVSPVNDCCGKEKAKWATFEEMKAAKQLPEGAVKMQKVGEEKYSDGVFNVNTRTYLVYCERDTTETHLTSYGYND